MLPLAAILWAGLVTALLIRAVIQYRHYENLEPMSPPPVSSAPSVLVIIPARNEEHNIGRCARALLAQDYPPAKWSAIVVNDNSSDGTAAVARENGMQLLDGAPLPPGWAGKPHACWQGARASSAGWLCFLDADTVPGPALLSTAVGVATARQFDLLSLEPRQELGSFWERVILPAGFFLLAFQQDLRRVNHPAALDAAANGQFILIRRSVYEAVGGHAGVRAEICEDSALARAVKRNGGKISLIGAEKLLRVRMYTGLSPLWEGLSKNVTEMLGGIVPTLVVAAGALFLAIVSVAAPVWAWRVVHGSWQEVASAVVISLASLALLSTHISGAFYFGIPFWYGFLFPLGYTIGSAIALNSVRVRWTKRVAWKGRIYEPPVTPPHVANKT